MNSSRALATAPLEETLPFPPDEYMALVCGPYAAAELRSQFEAAGPSLVDALATLGMLGDNTRFLDIGCGCGRVARYLLEKPLASYVGFDRHRGMIDWCRQEIGARSAKFNFMHFDIKSAYQKIDGQTGAIIASDFRFPFADNAFDSILLSSVFTHMPMDEIGNYLSEIYRVMSEDGTVLLSAFHSDGDKEIISERGVDFYVPKDRFLSALETCHFKYIVLGAAGEQVWYALDWLPESELGYGYT